MRSDALLFKYAYRQGAKNGQQIFSGICPPLPHDSADRGGAAGGGVMKESTSPLHELFCLPTCRKAATRLWVNPFGSIEPLPLYRRRRGDTGEDIAMFQILSYGERLHQHRIICLYRRQCGDTGEDIAMFQILSYRERLHQHRIICLYRRRRGDTGGGDIAGGGLWLRGWVKCTLFSFGCENGILLSNQIDSHLF